MKLIIREPCNPTIARKMPRRMNAGQLLGTEPFQGNQSMPTSDPTPKRLARLVALSRLTRGVVGGSFTLNPRIAFASWV